MLGSLNVPRFLRHSPSLLTCIAGWLNQHQQRIIDYVVEENRVLREQLGVATEPVNGPRFACKHGHVRSCLDQGQQIRTSRDEFGASLQGRQVHRNKRRPEEHHRAGLRSSARSGAGRTTMARCGEHRLALCRRRSIRYHGHVPARRRHGSRSGDASGTSCRSFQTNRTQRDSRRADVRACRGPQRRPSRVTAAQILHRLRSARGRGSSHSRTETGGTGTLRVGRR